MSEQFKVGEIAIGQNHIFDVDRNGMECEITGQLQMRDSHVPAWDIDETTLAYEVRWADGEVRHAEPGYLRRRKPPAADSNERTFMQRWRDMADKAPQRVGETV